ncbi:MAG: methyltransferase domain-containing protein [Candidatus Omnitrophota bacterium]
MKPTDWDHYYRQPYKLNTILKRIVTRRLMRYIRRYVPQDKAFSILEFGGGNSCFFDIFDQTFQPTTYYIVDNNRLGLDALHNRSGNRRSLVLLHRDMMEPGLNIECDLVFSVGLIEHFSPEDTRKAILAHLQAVKKGGILILGFPTPTFLYRVARKVSELLGQWIFHDERPLKTQEVASHLTSSCSILDSGIVWPIIFTQAFIVAKKNE